MKVFLRSLCKRLLIKTFINAIFKIENEKFKCFPYSDAVHCGITTVPPLGPSSIEGSWFLVGFLHIYTEVRVLKVMV